MCGLKYISISFDIHFLSLVVVGVPRAPICLLARYIPAAVIEVSMFLSTS